MHATRFAEYSSYLIVSAFFSASLLPVSAGSGQFQQHRVSLWIDRKETLKLIGLELDFYVVKNGVLIPFLRNSAKEISLQLPVLPPEVVRVEFMWTAEDNESYSYWFKEIRSLNREVLYDPLLSINRNGTVPRNPTGFHLSVPCTFHSPGVAAFIVEIQLRDARGLLMPGFPLSFYLRKRCEVVRSIASSFSTCERPCQNGGVCVSGGDRCACPAGTHGTFCQLTKRTFCHIPCLNGGTCQRNRFCACAKGYAGRFCQTALCSQWCGVHGRCAEVNQCRCHRGWRGRFCNKTLNRLDNVKRRANNNKQRRYKNENKILPENLPRSFSLLLSEQRDANNV